MQIEYLHSDHEFHKMTCLKAFGIRRVLEMLYSLINAFINIYIYGTCYRCKNITLNKFELSKCFLKNAMLEGDINQLTNS